MKNRLNKKLATPFLIEEKDNEKRSPKVFTKICFIPNIFVNKLFTIL